jgi:hypothetical protein
MSDQPAVLLLILVLVFFFLFTPALAPASSSSSALSSGHIRGNPPAFLDYDQEPVQVQEEEED